MLLMLATRPNCCQRRQHAVFLWKRVRHVPRHSGHPPGRMTIGRFRRRRLSFTRRTQTASAPSLNQSLPKPWTAIDPVDSRPPIRST